jgi:hypothetical protein
VGVGIYKYGKKEEYMGMKKCVEYKKRELN